MLLEVAVRNFEFLDEVIDVAGAQVLAPVDHGVVGSLRTVAVGQEPRQAREILKSSAAVETGQSKNDAENFAQLVRRRHGTTNGAKCVV